MPHVILLIEVDVLSVFSCLEVCEELFSIWRKRATLCGRVLEQYLLHRFKVFLFLHLLVLVNWVRRFFVV